MNDLISRSSIYNYIKAQINPYGKPFKGTAYEFGLKVMDYIENATTVEAAPVVHGEWIRVPSSDMMTGAAYKCSECGKLRFGSYLPNFCQHCGADMRKRVTE